MLRWRVEIIIAEPDHTGIRALNNMPCFCNYPPGRLQAVTFAFQLAVGAVSAGEGTSALGEDGRGDVFSGKELPIQEVISRKSLAVQILDREGRNRMEASIFLNTQPGTE